MSNHVPAKLAELMDNNKYPYTLIRAYMISAAEEALAHMVMLTKKHKTECSKLKIRSERPDQTEELYSRRYHPEYQHSEFLSITLLKEETLTQILEDHDPEEHQEMRQHYQEIAQEIFDNYCRADFEDVARVMTTLLGVFIVPIHTEETFNEQGELCVCYEIQMVRDPTRSDKPLNTFLGMINKYSQLKD